MALDAAPLPQYRYVAGRGLNTLSEDYELPSDSPEMERLNVQHRMWKLLYGGENGLYPHEIADKMENLLNGPERNMPTVLDLGSGSGIWVKDMAEHFPRAEVVGFDLTKPNVPITFPSNCQFVTGDFTKGFSSDDEALPLEFKAHFDVVHVRAVVGHLKDVQACLEIFAQCVKPGGVFILPDADFNGAWDTGHALVPPASVQFDDNAGRSWFSTWQLAVKAGVGPHFCQPFEDRVDWMQQSGIYEGVERRDYYAPLGWDRDIAGYGKELSEIMKENVKAIDEGFRYLYPRGGWSTEDIDVLISRLQSEINNPHTHLYMKWYVTWGVKRSEQA